MNKVTKPQSDQVFGGSNAFPAILQLKRISIRYFPDRKVVALYYSNKLKRYFSIPAGNNGELVAEETNKISATNKINKVVPLPNRLKVRQYDKPKSVLLQLRDLVAKNQAGVLRFKDGTKRNIDIFTAKAVVGTHTRLKDKNNKLRFSMLLNRRKDKFNDALNFVKKHHK